MDTNFAAGAIYNKVSIWFTVATAFPAGDYHRVTVLVPSAASLPFSSIATNLPA